MWPLLWAATSGATDLGIEADLTLTFPATQIGLGPGGRLVGEVAPDKPERLTLGAEADLRLPASYLGVLSDPALRGEVEVPAGLTVLGLGARGAWHFGPLDGVHARLGLGLGVALLRAHAEGPAGDTVDRATTVWARPQGGVLIPLGPDGRVRGQLTLTGLVGFAPADLLVVQGGKGGVAVAVGYRLLVGGASDVDG